MSTNGSSNGTVLTGNLIEMGVPDDPDEPFHETTHTFMGATTDDIEIERDIEEIDWQEHMVRQTQRREGFESGEATQNYLVTTSLDNLLDADLLEENEDLGIYEPAQNTVIEAYDYMMYERDTDDVPAQVYRCYDVQPVMETIEAGIEDPITIETLMWLKGAHGFISDDLEDETETS